MTFFRTQNMMLQQELLSIASAKAHQCKSLFFIYALEKSRCKKSTATQAVKQDYIVIDLLL